MLKIAIDPGHYLGNPKGVPASLDPNQTREWTLNDRVADYLINLLDGYDCQYIRVDDPTGKTFIDLGPRCDTANDWGADVYLSIHHNGGINGGTGGGTVVYYNAAGDRPKQAQDLYDCIVNRTGLRGNRATPVSKRSYYVLNNTTMPAFLIENGFMDSKTDAPIILTPEHAENTAKGIVDFLEKDFGLVKKEGVPVEPETIRYNTVEECPEWGQETVRKLIENGLLSGTGEGLNLSEDMLRVLVINDRAGLYN